MGLHISTTYLSPIQQHQSTEEDSDSTDSSQENHPLVSSLMVPSVLWRCWLSSRKGIRPIKNWLVECGVVICLERGADLHMALLMPLPLNVSCFSKIQIGFTFLVLAYPGSPGRGPLKGCVCVCVCTCARVCVWSYCSWSINWLMAEKILHSLLWLSDTSTNHTVTISWENNNMLKHVADWVV